MSPVEWGLECTALFVFYSLGAAWVLWETGRAIGNARIMAAAFRSWLRDRQDAELNDVFESYGVVYRIGSQPLAAYVHPDNPDARSGVTHPPSPTGGACHVAAAARPVRAA